MQDVQPTDQCADPAPKVQRDQALTAMFKPNELVWIVDESYNPVDTTWRVDLVRQGLQGVWMRQRYRYDTPSGVIYFVGEKPINETELAAARRMGRQIGRTKS
ncbi:MAG: hypothetical protein MI924_28045 [Chloroflexales bacterium]|nr:hypothetical protein [Chloroflexales bacterium]